MRDTNNLLGGDISADGGDLGGGEASAEQGGAAAVTAADIFTGIGFALMAADNARLSAPGTLPLMLRRFAPSAAADWTARTTSLSTRITFPARAFCADGRPKSPIRFWRTGAAAFMTRTCSRRTSCAPTTAWNRRRAFTCDGINN